MPEYEYEGETCVRALCYVNDENSDSDAIEMAINYAKENNINTVLLDGQDWHIDRSILYYSGLTLIVDGVMIKQNDEVFDNIFRPENLMVDEQNPYGYAKEITKTENVKILGKNGASLEGPDAHKKLYNWKKGTYEDAVTDIWGWRGFLAYFTLCDSFEFSGFKISKTRVWAISADRSTGGHIHDIEFNTTCTNGDGIDIRIGCNNFVIENIYGKTSDDFIALNNAKFLVEELTDSQYLYPLLASDYLYNSEEPESRDIHDITIKNIHSATDNYSQAVAFLARHGNSIYNIELNGIYDENPVAYPRRVDIVGAYYDLSYGELNGSEIYNITVDGLVSNSTRYAILFRQSVKGVTVKNVTQNNGWGVVVKASKDDKDEIEIDESCYSFTGTLFEDLEPWVEPWA